MTNTQEAEQTAAVTDAETETEEEQVPDIDSEAEADVAPAEEDMTLLLEDARSKADEHWDIAVRAKAELENLRKRHDRDLANAHKYALERFVSELLPVRDSMELGLDAAHGENADLDKLREGTELTLNLLSAAMDKFNIEAIDPQDQTFDPALHQAMSMQPVEGVDPNTVVNVVQKGYTLNGRLVRPAMVIVSQAT
ncbi:Heat shock protein GrpE [hydrothermal vent metagenome]|uniref:Heat shock protein GrpE n=1 Tax=hydrothermal vent metagenome TaxID=652676 RepID=A0A3B1B385_9ZZZZ